MRHFVKIFRLLSRHAVTSLYLTRYGDFSDYDGYSADTRNINPGIVLWQIQSSDYAADTRNSKRDKEIWPSGIFSPRGTVCLPYQLATLRWTWRSQMIQKGKYDCETGQFWAWGEIVPVNCRSGSASTD